MVKYIVFAICFFFTFSLKYDIINTAKGVDGYEYLERES